MMGFIDKLRTASTKTDAQSRIFPERVRIPFRITEEQLNRMAAQGLGEDKRLRTLRIACVEDALDISGGIAVAGLPLNFTTRLAIEQCVFSPRKVIVIRRLDTLSLGGDNLLASLFAYVVKVLVCGLFGVDLGAFSLKGVEGLTIDKERITADLDAMGAGDALKQALREKLISSLNLGPVKALMMGKLLDAADAKILENLSVTNIVITTEGISLDLEVNLDWLG